MTHVLIGFAEALPAAEVVFSLRAAGHRVSAFARAAAGPLRHLPLEALHVMPDPGADWAGGASDWLRGLMDGPGAPDLLLPLDDAGLWLANAALPGDPRIAGARGDCAALALDKIRQFALAREAGLAVPATWHLRGPEDLPEDLPLPALIKPALALTAGAGGIDKGRTLYLMEPGDLPRARALLAEATQPYVAQPLVAGSGTGVFGFATPGGVQGWSAHRRVRMMNPHGSGASACAPFPVEPALAARIEAFLTLAEWRGPFMMEFLQEPGGPTWFMELNGRMWGSMALARRQGFEYPAWAVAQAQAPDFAPPPPAPGPALSGPVRHLGRELLHLLFVLRGPKSAFHRAHWPSFRESLAGVLRPAPRRQFYNHDPAHRGYMLRDALWTLRRGLGR
jgi:hypothetical protein